MNSGPSALNCARDAISFAAAARSVKKCGVSRKQTIVPAPLKQVVSPRRAARRVSAPQESGNQHKSGAVGVNQASASAYVGTPSHDIVQPLSEFLRWARLELHQSILEATGVAVDRSAIVILETLHQYGPMRMSELAEKVRLDRSTVSRQVAAVTESGLVGRASDSRDARAAVLSLTPRGQAVRYKVNTAWHDIAGNLIRDWEHQDQVQFVRLMRKLVHQLSQESG